MAGHSTAAEITSEVVARLTELADPDRAAYERRYLKSRREHLGVRVPDVRRTVRSVARARGVRARQDVLAVAVALWSAHVHERCLVAVELLGAHARRLETRDLDLVESLLRECRTWALVDNLAEKVAGDIVARHPEAASVLDRWARDPDFWLRRSALLALLRPLRAGDGDFERFSRYADGMLDESEFFIRKAIGWVLRETAKRRPELVVAWLAARADRVPGVALREAVKYLPARSVRGGLTRQVRTAVPRDRG